MWKCVVAMALLGGCAAKQAEGPLVLQAPAAVDGAARIELENDLTGAICDVHWDTAPNMLPKGRTIEPGTFARSTIRPDNYHFTATTCAGDKREVDLVIRGYTIIHFVAQATASHTDAATHEYLVFSS